MPIVKIFSGLALIFWLTGCEEKFPVYAAFSEQGARSFECLHYSQMDTNNQKRIQKALTVPHTEACPYHLQLITYHIGKCNNPAVKSRGSDFDGYVRIEIRKGFDVLYKVQSDFKNDSAAAYKRVLEHAAKDIGHSMND